MQGSQQLTVARTGFAGGTLAGWQVDFRMIIARYRGSLSLPKETLTSPLLSNHLNLSPSVNLSMNTWQAH